MAEVRTFTWTLGELPSAQHRAGLAGLVLYLRWMEEREREPRGVFSVDQVTHDSATVSLDQEGLEFVFDRLYAASTELQPQPNRRRNPRTKEVVLPADKTETEDVDPKSGKAKRKKQYWYPVTVPHGGPIADWDQTEKKLYLKVWRDMVWQIPRGIPAQRTPFQLRADGKRTADGADAWRTLNGTKPVELGSTLFFGAQSKSAEGVPFRDCGRYEFLLHFQPYAIQVYVPTMLVRDDGRNGRAYKTEFQGYALVIPDVAELDTFCDELPRLLRERDGKAQGYRPKGAVIDLAVSSAVDFHWALRTRIAQRVGQQATSDLVAACDVLHLEKEGNNIRLRGSWRIPPDEPIERQHQRLRDALWSPLFRRQRLENLIYERPFSFGFDRIAMTQPIEATLDDGAFRHDARFTFEERPEMSESNNTDLPSIIYRLVGRYLTRRLEQKHGLRWDQVKDLPREDPRRKQFDEMRRDVARDAFLAARGRLGADFVEFFVATLCSVDQGMPEESFSTLATALAHAEQRDTVRTLTLLALSARS